MSNLEPVSPGQPWKPRPAREENLVVAATNAFAGSRHGQAAGAPFGDKYAYGPPATRVKVRNTSGAVRDRFHVLGLNDGVIVDPSDNLNEFKSNFALTGTTPTTASHTGKFCVLQEPIGNNKPAPAVINGVTVVKLDVQNANDTHAEVKDGDATQLTTGTSGSARILYKESGTGTKWGIVRIDGQRAGAGLKRHQRDLDDNGNPTPNWIYCGIGDDTTVECDAASDLDLTINRNGSGVDDHVVFDVAGCYIVWFDFDFSFDILKLTELAAYVEVAAWTRPTGGNWTVRHHFHVPMVTSPVGAAEDEDTGNAGGGMLFLMDATADDEMKFGYRRASGNMNPNAGGGKFIVMK